MSHTVTRSGFQGQTPYRTGSAGLDANTWLDFETAVFVLDNQVSSIDGDGQNSWPVDVRNSPGVIIDGGTIQGEINMTGDFQTVYDYGNSAGVTVQYSAGVIIRDWRMTNVFDGVNVSWECSNFLVEDIWITGARDDAVQNDKVNSGIIRDSLFDNVFAGISLDPSNASPVDGSDNDVTIDGVLIHMNLQNYEGEMTHASWIKTDSATLGAVTPRLHVFNTIVAIEDVTHHSYRSTADAWIHQVEGANNYYLNLTDTPLPSNYPLPPSGSWTVLQGQAARDYWDNAKADWIAAHDGSPPVDLLPDAVNDSKGTVEAGAATALMDVFANDTLGDTPTTITSFDAVSAHGGTVTKTGTDDFTFTALSSYEGPDSFTYRITDADGDFDTATVSVNVNRDDFPVANNDSGSTVGRTPVVIADTLANDIMGDGINTITAFDSTSVNGGSVTRNGDDFTYIAAAGFAGNDTFTYRLTDADGDFDLATVSVAVASQSGVVDKRIVAGTDDAEERGAGTTVDLTSSDMELVQDGSVNQKVGLRFTGIDIPEGAIIDNAYIKFTTDEVFTGAHSVTIKGEDSGNSFTFANTPQNISSRAMTDASASWSSEGWSTIGSTHNTTNLSSIVQEITDRADWTSGDPLTFVFTGTGTRTAEAYESGAGTAPLLHVEWHL